MGLNGSLLWTLKVDTGRCLSPSRTKRRLRFEPAAGSCLSSTRSPLVSATHLPPCLMDRVLAGLHWETRLFYLDDIIVFSSTWEEHLARLREVFERLRHAKLKLGAAKCTFAAKEVSYLGHRVTEEGLLPDPSLLAAIRDIPPPKTATEVRSFLGLAGYYRWYVKGFAAIAAPLHALPRKDAVFHWSEDCQNSFDQLKLRLTTSPITAFPDFSQEFRWSAALEEYDFTVRHRPGKIQTHGDGLSHLPVGPAPPEDALLHLQVDSEEEARRLAQELHTATHLGGQALRKLFSDRYFHKAGRRICIEVAQSCPQCQRGSDYGHCQKTMGTIESKGPWDTLSVDIVGPLPADRRHEFVIVFVDCFSRYTVLVPASNHTADTVSEALLRHVVPYFGTPRRLLSDRGREFVGEVWGKLTHSLGIQRLLTSPYHPEGNSINERSHRTMNNMLRARLLRDLPSRKWVTEIPGIMLTLNAMVHEPHGFSASMIATGREPTLPPDLEGDACASPSLEDPVAYVDMVRQRLALTHQQMTPPPAPVAINPYHEEDLIFVMTTLPERSSKLAPQWKGPFFIKRVPNAYQVTYEDGMAWRTVHINHVKPAKTPVGGFPVPMPIPEPPLPPPVYLPRSYQWKRPAKLPQPAAPAAEPPQPAAPVAEPTQPAAASLAVTPPLSRPTTRSSANHNLAPRSEPQSPATPRRTNENSRLGQPLRRSARLNPTAMCINSQPQAAPAHSRTTPKMARTYPYSLPYRTCFGRLEDPYSFSSIYIEDLYSGQKTYIKHIQQIVDALPKTMDPTSRFSLRAQVTPTGHQRMHDSLRTALWWLLPKDGDFRRASDGLHYYLARQGRRVVLRGGNVTSPLHESRLHWIHDPNPNQSHHVEPKQTVSRNNTVPMNNTVPRNNIVKNSDSISRNPLDPIPSTSWYNSSFSVPSASFPRNSLYSHSRSVPRIAKENTSVNEMSASAK